LRRLILSLWCVLSLFPLAAVSGCGNSSQAPLDFGNAPVQLPQHVGYALAHIHNCVAVVDLDKDEIVAIHRVAMEEESVGDIGVASDGTLFVCISHKGLETSNIIRVVDPSTGEITTEIVVSRGPQRTYSVPGDLAIVEHPYLPYGSEEFACDVIDMNRATLDRTLYFKGIAVEVLHNPEGKYFIGVFDAIEKYGGYTLVEFDPETRNTVGTPITLHTDFGFETVVFAAASKMYAPMEPSESPPTSSTVRPLGVLEFPSGRLLSTITIPFDVLHMVRAGQRVYVASFLGSTWKGALEVGKGVVSVVDPNTDQVVKTLEVSPGPQHMAYSESTGKLYVACVDGKISVIDTATDEVTGTIVCDDPRASEWGFNRIKVAS
jgi:DNA-binding beta-propeller fold protein YncE